MTVQRHIAVKLLHYLFMLVCFTAISSDKQDNIEHEEPYTSLLKFIYYWDGLKNMYDEISQLIWCLLKVSKSRKHFSEFSFFPKNERKMEKKNPEGL